PPSTPSAAASAAKPAPTAPSARTRGTIAPGRRPSGTSTPDTAAARAGDRRTAPTPRALAPPVPARPPASGRAIPSGQRTEIRPPRPRRGVSRARGGQASGMPEPPPARSVRPATREDVPALLPMVQAICDWHEALDPRRFDFVPGIAQRYARWLPQRIDDPESVVLVAEAGGPGAAGE